MWEVIAFKVQSISWLYPSVLNILPIVFLVQWYIQCTTNKTSFLFCRRNQARFSLPKITIQTSTKVSQQLGYCTNLPLCSSKEGDYRMPEEHLHVFFPWRTVALCLLGFQTAPLVAVSPSWKSNLTLSLKRSMTMSGVCLTWLFGLLCSKRLSQSSQLSTDNLLLLTLADKDYPRTQ